MKRICQLACLLLPLLSVCECLMAQNDKQVIGDAVFTIDEIEAGVEVVFLVRFENTGPDTAFNVVIRDTLDPRYDASTLYMIDASHGYQLLREQGFIRWYFNGIRLPGNDPDFGSSTTGYVLYAVQPHRFLSAGQSIQNRACISFDNETVCTNTASIWIESGSSGSDEALVKDRLIQVIPNPNYGRFEVKHLSTSPTKPISMMEWWITDMNGKVVHDGAVNNPDFMPEEVFMERASPGLYLLWVKENARLQVEQFAVIR